VATFSKLYLTALTAPYIPATIRGAWDDTAGAITARAADTVSRAGGTAASVARAEANATGEYDVLLGRWVGPRCAAGQIACNLDVCINVKESSTSADMHWHLHVYWTVGDTDVVRATAVADLREAAGVNEWTTDGYGRVKTLNAAVAIDVTVQDGDRPVFEIGYTARNTVTTSYTGTLWYGTADSFGTALPDAVAGEAPAGNSYLVASFITFSSPVTAMAIEERVSQIVVESATTNPTPELRVSQVVVESAVTEASIVQPAPASAGTAANILLLSPLLFTPAPAAAGTGATVTLGALVVAPVPAVTGTHAQWLSPVCFPLPAQAGTAAGLVLLVPLEVVPAPAAAGTLADWLGPVEVVPSAAEAGTAALATVRHSGALEVTPAPAAAGVQANLWGLYVETHGSTVEWIVFPEPAGCGTSAVDPFAWGYTGNPNLVTFPALQASTPREGLLVGFTGFGWLDLARGGMTLEGELSVTGLGGGAVAFPLAQATGALLYGGLGGSGILEIAPPMTASGGDSPDSGTSAAPLPFPAVIGTGLAGGILTGSIEIRAPDATGWLASDGDYAGAVALPSLALAGTVVAGMPPIAAALSLPALLASGTLLPERSGVGALLLPALVLTASGSSTATTLAGVLVLRPLDLFGEMATPAPPDFAALGVYVSAMNLRAEAVSDYERFPFNSYARRHGLMLAAKDDGIWELEGEKDDTFDIFAEIHKMSFDLESFQHKRMTDAFFHLHSNGGYRIDIYADGVRSGRDVEDPGGGIHAWKVPLPRGLKGQGLGIRVTNTAGSYILLDEVEMVSEFTSRRNR